MAYAVRQLDARALSLSLCHWIDDRNTTGELTRLRRVIGPEVAVFVGGAGADAAADVVRRIGALLINDLKVFRRRLEQLASNGWKDTDGN
jgi:hypothetical protein